MLAVEFTFGDRIVDVDASNPTLLLSDATIAAGAISIHISPTLVVSPTPALPSCRIDAAGGTLRSWPGPRWTGAWDARRWRQTIDILSRITHTTQE